MAKKKGEANVKIAATDKPSKTKGRPRSGPWWRERDQRWMATFFRKQYCAPVEIGRSNLDGAMYWYRDLAEELGITLDDPATPAIPQKIAITLTPETYRDLAELVPMVAREHLLAGTSQAHAISVAIREAVSRRRKARG